MDGDELSTRTPLLFLSNVGEETGHVIGPLYWQLVKFDTVSLYIANKQIKLGEYAGESSLRERMKSKGRSIRCNTHPGCDAPIKCPEQTAAAVTGHRHQPMTDESLNFDTLYGIVHSRLQIIHCFLHFFFEIFLRPLAGIFQVA